jgi:hypothetical protein
MRVGTVSRLGRVLFPYLAGITFTDRAIGVASTVKRVQIWVGE